MRGLASSDPRAGLALQLRTGRRAGRALRHRRVDDHGRWPHLLDHHADAATRLIAVRAEAPAQRHARSGQPGRSRHLHQHLRLLPPRVAHGAGNGGREQRASPIGRGRRAARPREPGSADLFHPSCRKRDPHRDGAGAVGNGDKRRNRPALSRAPRAGPARRCSAGGSAGRVGRLRRSRSMHPGGRERLRETPRHRSSDAHGNRTQPRGLDRGPARPVRDRAAGCAVRLTIQTHSGRNCGRIEGDPRYRSGPLARSGRGARSSPHRRDCPARPVPRHQRPDDRYILPGPHGRSAHAFGGTRCAPADATTKKAGCVS